MLDHQKSVVADLFGSGALYCAEIALKLIAEAGGRDPGPLTPMATGFCSGMARSCGQCGAVSGAVMGIGLFAGRPAPGGEHDPAYALTQEFQDRFRTAFGSINCHDLTGCDFATPEGQAQFREQNVKSRCIEFVVLAVDTALDLLRDSGHLPAEADFVRSRLAPCGLLCSSCLAFDGGPIQQNARALQAALGDNFAAYAERFAAMNPVFGDYPAFRRLLDYLASGSCTGCREAGCLFKSCGVTACVRERSLDYCFQCADFPCDHHGMPGPLAERWQANNEAMRALGPAPWFFTRHPKPRYP
ncbi:MAG: C-GCAxxG-C-C family protein [Pseudodesulfovibrio sp.]|uniref:C_GCAxxG_C_C family protein n=1 Tax=Pseudodesulfovibrio aespoeensis (strain ATCC 700646 / DSM 10631 / Aspo-2) TaxID=643562 RepID=E6VUL5_PSEA9|nr:MULTISPECIES: C-GCAxxG-C-C family (seleno)protein [Pseudodesulfovibrio]MBU4191098.1 C-GCAxxG-C-C family protein [Pseudomonadota bacterium]ADU61160.1 C_GCAxxG_C_C family protein [Pseudodesulfovibrio aespoeensis Aspo-2]MBU4243656.1 C-GCAxxG-C-C family protein [Pseudomonadota bacterium]MBU4379167.1 C-GCAxxG-C-C family protein [Pseudomonadota bacterium]MBU4475028.1 C-GCAxxG-C-C family protein [Pseudomonadota bacterium]